jgi:hypothetical protein
MKFWLCLPALAPVLGSGRIRAFFAESESENFVPDSDSDLVLDPVIYKYCTC